MQALGVEVHVLEPCSACGTLQDVTRKSSWSIGVSQSVSQPHASVSQSVSHLQKIMVTTRSGKTTDPPSTPGAQKGSRRRRRSAGQVSSRATLCIACRARNAPNFGLRFMTPRVINRILFLRRTLGRFLRPAGEYIRPRGGKGGAYRNSFVPGSTLVYAGLASAQHPRTRALTTTMTATSCRRRSGKGTKGHGGDTREVGGPKGERMRARGGSRKSELLRGVTSYFGKQLLRVDT